MVRQAHHERLDFDNITRICGLPKYFYKLHKSFYELHESFSRVLRIVKEKEKRFGIGFIIIFLTTGKEKKYPELKSSLPIIYVSCTDRIILFTGRFIIM
jgi:hypothetical protein